MKYPLLIFSLLLLVFVSCKKDKTTDPQNNSSGQPAADGSPTNSTNFSAFLEARMNYHLTPADTLDGVPWLMPMASFTSSPGGFWQTGSMIPVDSVSLNSIGLKFDGFYYYEDTTYMPFYAPCNWKVKSNTPLIPSFSYTNPDSLPGFSGYASLPDTFKVGKQLDINLTGLSNHNKVICAISDNSGSGTFIIKTIQTTNPTVMVSFSISQTAQLTAGSGGFLFVMVMKENGRVFGGKNIDFINEFVVGNDVVVN